MPAYEFENRRHGVHVTLVFPVDKRPSKIVLKRRSVPSQITVGVGAKPETLGSKLQRGYRDLEEKGTFRGKPKPGQMSVAQIQKAIAMPDTD